MFWTLWPNSKISKTFNIIETHWGLKNQSSNTCKTNNVRQAINKNSKLRDMTTKHNVHFLSGTLLWKTKTKTKTGRKDITRRIIGKIWTYMSVNIDNSIVPKLDFQSVIILLGEWKIMPLYSGDTNWHTGMMCYECNQFFNDF